MRGIDKATNRQLLGATWPFLMVVVLLVGLASVSLLILSSVRAYIGGESTWSKGQKDAAFYLSVYGRTGDPATFDKYQAAIAYPLALQRARLALDRTPPDVAAARDALMFSGVYPGDVGGVIWVFRTFRELDDFKTAVGYWRAGDALVNRMATVGERMHAALTSATPGADNVDRLTDELEQINETVSPISIAFSNVLSDAFRKVATLLLVINGVVAVVLVVLSGIYARRYLSAMLRSMSEHREYVESLAWQATHDTLTGLLNREEFERRLDEVVAVRASGGWCPLTTLLVLDLDQFKAVNDSYGHAAGDVMLQQIAQFLDKRLAENEFAGRLGGDEFGLLLSTPDGEAAHERAEGIRRSFTGFEWTWGTHHLGATASIGVVDLRVNAQSDAKLALRYADVACYMAKARGRDRVQIASSADGELTRQVGEVSWAGRIRDALAHERFALYLQPICRSTIEFEPGRPVEHFHHEILLRMRGEDGSVIAPGAFIPAAERYGLMSAIDRWVVKESLRRISRLGNDPRVEYAINLSGASIGDERFIDFLMDQISHSGVRAQSLCFEITETTAVANLGIAGQFIAELKERGCRFALDDFGVGMSSFGYLKGLPVDYLKIDGSFIKDMVADPVNQDMVAAINDIAHSMGRKTIAEYVEDRETFLALRGMGVDFVQGYYFGRPQAWVSETHAATLS